MQESPPPLASDVLLDTDAALRLERVLMQNGCLFSVAADVFHICIKLYFEYSCWEAQSGSSEPNVATFGDNSALVLSCPWRALGVYTISHTASVQSCSISCSGALVLLHSHSHGVDTHIAKSQCTRTRYAGIAMTASGPAMALTFDCILHRICECTLSTTLCQVGADILKRLFAARNAVLTVSQHLPYW
jgi:hypothetical protein